MLCAFTFSQSNLAPYYMEMHHLKIKSRDAEMLDGRRLCPPNIKWPIHLLNNGNQKIRSSPLDRISEPQNSKFHGEGGMGRYPLRRFSTGVTAEQLLLLNWTINIKHTKGWHTHTQGTQYVYIHICHGGIRNYKGESLLPRASRGKRPKPCDGPPPPFAGPACRETQTTADATVNAGSLAQASLTEEIGKHLRCTSTGESLKRCVIRRWY